MLKIRDFARLAEVSMTTLRYYDEDYVSTMYLVPGSGIFRRSIRAEIELL
jgi:hypothetical protein